MTGRPLTAAEWAARERLVLAAFATLEARGEYPAPLPLARESGMNVNRVNDVRNRLRARGDWPESAHLPTRGGHPDREEQAIADLAARIAGVQAGWPAWRRRHRPGLVPAGVSRGRVRIERGGPHD